MRNTKSSKTKQCLFAIAECMKEQSDLWVNAMIGITHPVYHRTFMGGGAGAVQRRRAAEAKRAYRRYLAYLKHQQWITMRRIGNQLQLALTPKGHLLVLKEHMQQSPPCRKNECVMVIFDIPEYKRSIRQQFRLLLKECGFTQLQRSVWINDKDVLHHIKRFIHMAKAHQWIRAFRAHDIE